MNKLTEVKLIHVSCVKLLALLALGLSVAL